MHPLIEQWFNDTYGEPPGDLIVPMQALRTVFAKAGEEFSEIRVMSRSGSTDRYPGKSALQASGHDTYYWDALVPQLKEG